MEHDLAFWGVASNREGLGPRPLLRSTPACGQSTVSAFPEEIKNRGRWIWRKAAREQWEGHQGKEARRGGTWRQGLEQSQSERQASVLCSPQPRTSPLSPGPPRERGHPFSPCQGVNPGPLTYAKKADSHIPGPSFSFLALTAGIHPYCTHIGFF